MSRDIALDGRTVTGAVGLVALPILGTGLTGSVDLRLTISAAVIGLVGALLLRAWTATERWSIVPLPGISALGLVAAEAVPGILPDLLAIGAAAGILLWSALGRSPVRTVAAGLGIPLLGGMLALLLAFAAPTGQSFVGMASALIALALVLTAIAAVYRPEPDRLPPPS